MKLMLGTVASLLLASPLFAQAGDITVNTGSSISCTNVKGESGFNVVAYTLGGSAASPRPGTGAGAGKPAISDLTIQKEFDACSEQLIKAFLSEKVMPTLVLTQYGLAAGRLYPAISITLTNAFINSYSIAGSAPGKPSESLAFSFSKVCVASQNQRIDGSIAPPVQVCYDILRNLVN